MWVSSARSLTPPTPLSGIFFRCKAPDPRPPVGASGFGMDRLDVGQQRHITHSPHALAGHFLSMQVLLKSSGTDIQDRALYRDRPVPAMPLNKGVLHRYSLAKYRS